MRKIVSSGDETYHKCQSQLDLRLILTARPAGDAEGREDYR